MTSDTGRACAARTTPDVFAVGRDGDMIYNGAIDDCRSANPADAGAANNHVRAARTEAPAGKPVSVARTIPYGCSVKY